MYNILTATHPFGIHNKKPLDLLKKTGWNLHYNTFKRRLTDVDLKKIICDIDVVIAGTEPYNKEVIGKANRLKAICRVGVGIDNIDFSACRKRNISVTYTPEAPSSSVADLTIAQIINLFRDIINSNKFVKNGEWKRNSGYLLSEKKIGVLGVGRIGSKVINRLKSFGVSPIYVCDLNYCDIDGVEWLSKKEMFKTCDLVTIHIPLNKKNYHCVGADEISIMKKGSFIINTSRGNVIDEMSLEKFILNGHLRGAALDVFDKEPYRGNLTKLDNIILTPHIGAMSQESRFLMEYGAVQDCIRLLNGEVLLNPVPDNEI